VINSSEDGNSLENVVSVVAWKICVEIAALQSTQYHTYDSSIRVINCCSVNWKINMFNVKNLTSYKSITWHDIATKSVTWFTATALFAWHLIVKQNCRGSCLYGQDDQRLEKEAHDRSPAVSDLLKDNKVQFQHSSRNVDLQWRRQSQGRCHSVTDNGLCYANNGFSLTCENQMTCKKIHNRLNTVYLQTQRSTHAITAGHSLRQMVLQHTQKTLNGISKTNVVRFASRCQLC